MTAVFLVIAGALTAGTGLAVWKMMTPAADGLLRSRLKERFVVTLTSGESFSGLLFHLDDRSVTLKDCTVLKQDGSAAPVDGELVLRRDAIAYMQRPTG